MIASKLFTCLLEIAALYCRQEKAISYVVISKQLVML